MGTEASERTYLLLDSYQRLPEEACLGSGAWSQEDLGPGIGKANILGNSKSICKSTELREMRHAKQLGLAEAPDWRRQGAEGTRVEQQPSPYCFQRSSSWYIPGSWHALPLIIDGFFFFLKLI